MRIFNIETTDMGSDQQDIADKVMDMVDGRNFSSKEEFAEIEGQLVTQACQQLGWPSVPQTGGLLVEWEFD